MSVTVNVQVQVDTSGDGESQSDVFNWLPNSNAPRSPSKITVSGNTTLTVPANAKGVVLIAPTAAGNYSVKGISADTGVFISAGAILAYKFGTQPTSIILFGSVSGLWTVLWA